MVLYRASTPGALWVDSFWHSGSMVVVFGGSSPGSPAWQSFELQPASTFATPAPPRAGSIRHASPERPPGNRPDLRDIGERRRSTVSLSTGTGGTSGEGSSQVGWWWEVGASSLARSTVPGLSRSCQEER